MNDEETHLSTTDLMPYGEHNTADFSDEEPTLTLDPVAMLLRSALDRITAYLAMPTESSLEAIVTAVEIAVRRLEYLEQRVRCGD